jgi:hypothetical protein
LGDHDICWVGEGAQSVMTYLPVSPETKYQNLQIRAIESLKSSPMHSTNPTTTTPPKKNYIQKTSYICPHRRKLIAKPLIFTRILPSKQTKYLVKLVDFV